MISSESEELFRVGSKILCPNCNFELEIQKPRIKLQKPKLLIVEGKDDECFFCALAEHLKIEDIQVAGVGGKTQIRGQLQAIVKDDDFGKVMSLGIIRDANSNPDDAFKSVKDALNAAGLPAPKRSLASTKGPPKVAVMIIPSHQQQGALEDLCLEAVAQDPVLICVDQYFACLDEQKVNRPKSLSKAKVRVFLASRKDPTLPLGISAQKGYWPLDNKAFSNIKVFLQLL